jgi:hypothetical protein
MEMTGIGKEFLSRTLNSISPATKKKDGQMDYMKLKTFCTAKEMISLSATHQTKD